MKLIISATDRENSFSLKAACEIQQIYRRLGESFEILDLRSIDFRKALKGPYGAGRSPDLKKACEKVAEAHALVIVCPEYNGSFPGIFKYFLDHWLYPDSFIKKPVCFVGLGGRFGGFRPLEHLTGIFSYRESLLFPEKVYIQNVQKVFSERKEDWPELLRKQAHGFLKFIKAQRSYTNQS